MNKTVVVTVTDGIVDVDELPDGVTVIVRDYDCTGVEPELITVDDYGDKCVEFIYEKQEYIATVQAYLKDDSSKQTMMLFLPIRANDADEARQNTKDHFDERSYYNLVQIISIVEKP